MFKKLSLGPAALQSILVSMIVMGSSVLAPPAAGQLSVTPAGEMVLDSNALVMATSGNFNFVINGSPFQQEALITHKGYQYAVWYHNGPEQDIFIGRRNLSGNGWEQFDTGYDMENGDESASSVNRRWDAHNVISMGISSDDRIHLSYDHHVDGLRYLTTNPGVASGEGGAWNSSVFLAERNSLNLGGSSIPRVTYPRFTNVADDMVFTFRDYGSGNGNVRLAHYDSQTGQWSGMRFVNRGRGTNQLYNDVTGNASNRRNAYHNGFHADSTGRLHTTWTWREGTQDGNHDVCYAYSDDQGNTWYNNDGVQIGTNSSPVTLNSPGTVVVSLDRHQSIINQQGQIVDAAGGVHVFMYHRRQEPGFEWQLGDGKFTHRPDSAYHHHYRDPLTGNWNVSVMTDEAIGSRPRMGVDHFGNLFGLYVQSNDLVIAAAEKTASGYSDWKVVFRDRSRIYDGTPMIDNARLLNDGVLAVFLQQRTVALSGTNPTGGTLRVMEFNVVPSLPVLGDVDLNGVVDFFDISPFIALLSRGDYQVEADVNQDSLVDFFDVSPFIVLLSN